MGLKLGTGSEGCWLAETTALIVLDAVRSESGGLLEIQVGAMMIVSGKFSSFLTWRLSEKDRWC